MNIKKFGLIAGFLLLASPVLAVDKFFGETESGSGSINSAPLAVYCKAFTSAYTGNITSFHLGYGDTYHIGLFNNALVKLNETYVTAPGAWGSVAFPSTAVTSGQSYTVCMQRPGGYNPDMQSGGNVDYYYPPTFYGNYVNGVGTLDTAITGQHMMLAAYGTQVVATPTPTPLPGGATYTMNGSVLGASTSWLSSLASQVFSIIPVAIGIVGGVIVTLFGLRWLIAFVRSNMHG